VIAELGVAPADSVEGVGLPEAVTRGTVQFEALLGVPKRVGGALSALADLGQCC
jgi:hypothetical protein